MVGYLVEVISGQSLDEFLEDRIFEPLGMNDTGFNVPLEQGHRLAANYTRGPDKELQLGDDPASSAYLKEPSYLSGGGGLVSTAGDYWRFCQMLLNGGELDGERILGPRTIQLMTMNHLTGGDDLPRRSVSLFSETEDTGMGFGLGFAVMMDTREAGGSSVGEYNWGGAASTIFWNDPAEDLTVIFMVQLMPSGIFNFRGQLRQLVCASIVD